MAENPRPPVAIRIVRPYETEEQLLENELETIGKTSVLLIGAHPRPTGVILRFEVTLTSGATVLRGEGRVLAHKENAFRGLAGLSLRFTRLDPRSKAVVDRATALREARGQAGAAPTAMATPSRPPPRPDPALTEALTAKTPAPPPQAPASKERPEPRSRPSGRPTRQMQRVEVPRDLTPPPAPVALVVTPPVPPIAPIASIASVEAPVEASVEDAPTHVPARPSQAKTLDAPANRVELLARLRDRAGKLPPGRLDEIRAAKR